MSDEEHKPTSDAPPTTPSQRLPSEPPTDPRGLNVGDAAGMRDLLLAIRSDQLAQRDEWETWKTERSAEKVDERRRMDSMSGGLRLLQGEMVVLQQDIVATKAAAEAARMAADQARERADAAHALADGATQATRYMSADHEGDKEALLAALTETRGEIRSAAAKLDGVTTQVVDLRKTDDELKAMVAEAAQDSADKAIRDVVDKNPKMIAALTAVLIVIGNMLSQRYLITPGAPNQGAMPAPAPTVHVAEGAP